MKLKCHGIMLSVLFVTDYINNNNQITNKTTAKQIDKLYIPMCNTNFGFFT